MSMVESRSLSEPLAIIVMGVSGCGKTSVGRAIAAAFDLDLLEGDSFHPDANIAKMSAGIPLTDEDRWPWLDRIGHEIARHAAEGASLVISCSSLRRIYRDRLRSASSGPTLFVFLDGSMALLKERMSRREGHFMPVSLLESQFATLENPVGENGVLRIDISVSKAEVNAHAIAAIRARMDP